MAIITTKSRRQPKQVGNVNVMHGNAAQYGGFRHFRAGHELAVPATTADGEKIYRTQTGKTFRVKKMSS